MGRMYEEVKLRPLYIVRAVEGIEPSTMSSTRTVVVGNPLLEFDAHDGPQTR